MEPYQRTSTDQGAVDQGAVKQGAVEIANGTPLTERSFSILVRHAHRAFVRVLAARLAPHGISVAEWAVLRVLWQSEGLNQVELAGRMRVRKASLTTVLNGLERKDCVRRVRPAADRRNLRLLLTERGREMQPMLLPHGAAINQLAAAGIDPGEAEIGRRVLERIIENLAGA
jgi:DNA-binding MarR family transcriptional regulator